MAVAYNTHTNAHALPYSTPVPPLADGGGTAANLVPTNGQGATTPIIQHSAGKAIALLVRSGHHPS